MITNRIISIDPGPEFSAYIVMDGEKPISFGKVPNAELMDLLEKTASNLYRCVIEMVACFGLAVGREIVETCVWIGRFMEAFRTERCDRITRVSVKSHVCNSAKARDTNVRCALIDRLGPPGTKKQPGATYHIGGDVWAALAVAVTWLDQRPISDLRKLTQE